MTTPRAKRLAVKYSPPTLLLEYEKKGKLRRRELPLARILTENNNDPSKVVSSLAKKHEKYFNAKVLNHAQLRKLIEQIIGKRKGPSTSSLGPLQPLQPLSRAPLKPLSRTPAVSSIDPEKDLNKASDQEVAAAKNKMSETFEANRLKPGDKGFQYDKRVDFANKKKEKSEWDEGSDDSFEVDFEE